MQKILIANRGEIACRIIRTCRQLGIHTVAIYSYADRHARHVKEADTAREIDTEDNVAAYLSIAKILAIATSEAVDAIHPGYGFLAENAIFSRECTAHGITFIGPSAAAMEMLGDKNAARSRALTHAVPVATGCSLPEDLEAAAACVRDFIRTHGTPALIKAAAGGGGKGMRLIEAATAIEDTITRAAREAEKLFGDGSLFIEQFIAPARHIEVQFLADATGAVGILFDRDCSLQRNNQKIIEEAPAPNLSEKTRAQLYTATRTLVSGTGYIGAGTAEFLVDEQSRIFFLEINTRLQVEHPVTEAITGIDLVALQIRAAAGDAVVATLPATPIPACHAIELRICAEASDGSFLPSSGLITRFDTPAGNAIRIDTGFESHDFFPSYFDSLLAKYIIIGKSRADTIEKAIQALAETVLFGVESNVAFLRALLTDPLTTEKARTESVAKFLAVYSYHELLTLAALRLLVFEFCKTNADFLLSSNRAFSVLPSVSRTYFIRDTEYVPTLHVTDTGEILCRCEDQKLSVSSWSFASSTQQLSLHSNGQPEIITVSRQNQQVWLACKFGTFVFRSQPPLFQRSTGTLFNTAITADLPGQVLSILVQPGQTVSTGEVLAVFESMKMEHEIKSPADTTITTIHITVGQQVSIGEVLFTLEPNPSTTGSST